MNLIIDEGNTLTKVALFKKGELQYVEFFEKATPEKIYCAVAQIQYKNAIYSSVADNDEKLESQLKNSATTYVKLTHTTPLPIKIEYSTPQTLGVDRIAGAVGAWTINNKSTSLIIDAGTAITYDVVTSEGIYKGGNISPGIDMRLKALNHFTKRLPLVSKPDEHNLLGTDTQTAIQSGVFNGVLFECEGYINKISKKISDIRIIITGGDHLILHNQLKNSTFATLIDEEYLVLKGLNTILRYNAEK